MADATSRDDSRKRIDTRPSWDEYFMSVAEQVATRSTCLRRQIGAVIVKDKRILSTGYNGAPSGLSHCIDVGCLREQRHIPSGTQHELCRALHAEENAVVQASRYGTAIAGATIYTTTHPCVMCTKMLLNAGIVEVVYRDYYPDELSEEMLAESGIIVRRFGDPEPPPAAKGSGVSGTSDVSDTSGASDASDVSDASSAGAAQ